MLRDFGVFGARYCLCAGALAALVALLSPAAAQALEDQLSLDLSAGYALVTDAPSLTHTGGADVGLGVGLGGPLTLRGSLGGQGWSGARTGPRPAARLLAEVTYALDVLSMVPAFGIGASALLVDKPRDTPHGSHAGAGGPHLVLSLDYLWSRRLNFGLDLRGLLYFPLGAPSWGSELKLRASVLFELF